MAATPPTTRSPLGGDAAPRLRAMSFSVTRLITSLARSATNEAPDVHPGLRGGLDPWRVLARACFSPAAAAGSLPAGLVFRVQRRDHLGRDVDLVVHVHHVALV